MALSYELAGGKKLRLAGWLRLLMGAGTALLLAAFFVVMLRQPFETVDDLIWLNKLGRDSFASLLLSPAWSVTSSFYRPVAEAVLKILYAAFGWDPRPYRYVQFAAIIVLLGLSLQLIRQLRLRQDVIFLLAVFLIGSPFISGSLAWLSELPHVIILICFAAGLVAITSDLPDSRKLAICVAVFAMALLSKENGMVLAVFLIYFIRKAPVTSTLAFASVVASYFAIRAIVLGPAMGLSSADEDVGYFFGFVSAAEKHAMFPGRAIYQLYAYNVAAQLSAILFRATAWGQIVGGINREVVIETASTVVIFVGGAAAYRKHGVVFLILVAVTIGGTVLSYSYARDRHLALPSLAYGFLLAMTANEMSERLARAPTVPLFCIWLAWSAQAGLAMRAIDVASLRAIEEIYRPNVTPPNPRLPIEVWTIAREDALRLH